MPAIAPIAARRLLLLRYTMAQQRRRAAIRSWILQNRDIEAIFNRYRHRLVLHYCPRTFELDNYDDTYCKEHMRFTKTEIRQFLPYLRLNLVPFRSRCTATPEVALCLVL
jgi:hypothetical protein